MTSHLDAGLLNLSHAALNGALRKLSLAEGLGVSALDLFPHLVQVRGSAIGDGVHRLQGLGDLLLHLGLLKLGQQLGTLSDLLLQLHGISLHCLLSLLSLLECLVVQSLGVFHALLSGDQLSSESFRGVLVLGGLGIVALSAGLISQLQSLLGIRLQLLYISQAAVKLHLQLALVTNHGSSLLRQFLVLALRFTDRLLDLDLRVCILFDLVVEEGHQVIPEFAEGISHGRVNSLSTTQCSTTSRNSSLTVQS